MSVVDDFRIFLKKRIRELQPFPLAQKIKN